MGRVKSLMNMFNNNSKKTMSPILKYSIAIFFLLWLIVITESKEKLNYLNSLKTDISKMQENMDDKEKELEKANFEKQAALNDISKLESDYTSLKQQTDDMTKKLDSKQNQIAMLSEELIGNKVNELCELLKDDNFKKIAKLIHPEKGVRISPSPLIDVNKNRVITNSELEILYKSSEKIDWGLIDSQSSPILLTFYEYYNKYIKDVDCLNSGKLQYASDLTNISSSKPQISDSSSTLYNNAINVDFLYEGTEDNNYTDWKSIRFVFEELNSSWYIVGIICNKN